MGVVRQKRRELFEGGEREGFRAGGEVEPGGEDFGFESGPAVGEVMF